MFNVILTIFLLLICVVICFGFFTLGYMAGIKVSFLLKGKKTDVSEEENNKKKKAERELKNFLEYTGYEEN